MNIRNNYLKIFLEVLHNKLGFWFVDCILSIMMHQLRLSTSNYVFQYPRVLQTLLYIRCYPPRKNKELNQARIPHNDIMNYKFSSTYTNVSLFLNLLFLKCMYVYNISHCNSISSSSQLTRHSNNTLLSFFIFSFFHIRNI